MAVITLSGPVSGVKELADPGNYHYTLRFRIANRPVITSIRMNLMENDQVTAVATDASEPNIVALRNDTTKSMYMPDEVAPKLSILGIIFGVLTIPLVGAGLLVLWMTWSNYQVSIKNRDSVREAKRILGPSPL